MDDRNPTVYILSNKPAGVLYTGVTSNVLRRIYEHKYGFIPSFSKKYNCQLLVYFEQFEYMYDAIEREKQIKAGSRKKKIQLIESMNPEWNDLYSTLQG